MSGLFIEFYLDEDVDVLVGRLLRARGFTAVATNEAGQLKNSDSAQLDYAVTNRKAFITHNRADFEALAREYLATGRDHYGIVIAVRRPPHELARRLLRILDQVTADEMRNQVRYI